MEFISLLLLFVGLIITGLFWRFKRDDFLASEADRCLNRHCEVDSNWSSQGRVYTKGLTVIEKDGKKRFVKQAKLCDIGILK